VGQRFAVFKNDYFMTKTLTTYEKDIVDRFLIKNNAPELDMAWFNHAIANTLPTWRSEQLSDTNNCLQNTEAYIDYVTDFINTDTQA
jgi:hypothetical protein